MAIWVTRTEPGASRLSAFLESNGYKTVVQPVFDIIALPFSPPKEPTDLWVFLSEHAVTGSQAYPWDQTKPCIGIGPRTTSNLHSLGVEALQPGAPSSEGIFELISGRFHPPLTITLVAGKSGRDDLARWLSQEGFRIQQWYVYKRQKRPYLNFKHIIETIVVLNTSCLEPVQQTIIECPVFFYRPVKLVVPSQRIAEQAKARGFKHIELAEDASDAAVIEVIRRLD